MKQVLVLSFVAAFLLTLPGSYRSHLVWNKAHVPLHEVQICNTKGDVKNIKANKLEKELGKGACRLPACYFEQVFLPKSGGDGFCDGITIPLISPADGVTARCTSPFRE